MKNIVAPLVLVCLLAYHAEGQTTEEIVEKYIVNIGGKSNWKKVKTLTTSGEYDYGGISFPFTTYAAAPNRYIPFKAKIMNSDRFTKPPNPAYFDVDDFTTAQLNRLTRIFEGNNTFIQTNWRLNFLLENGMFNNIIMGKRLFDHQQLKFIQCFQAIDFF